MLSLGLLATAALAGEASGARRMAAGIEQIIQSANLEQNFYLNAKRADYYCRQLDSPIDLRAELKLRLRLAEELLQAGGSAGSVRELERLRSTSAERGIVFAPWYAQQLRSLLAIAYLRLGEQENCITASSPACCPSAVPASIPARAAPAAPSAR